MDIKNWKLKLKYGKLKTPYKPYTALCDGVFEEIAEGFECRNGPAYMSIKTWATDANESVQMLFQIGKQIGFTAKGKVDIFETEPIEPPRDHPYGYDIKFKPYSKK